MRCAILPVYCKGTERQTSITKVWLQRLGAVLERYYDRQSGGRSNLTCTVFEWLEIPMTTEQWIGAGAVAGRQTYQALASEGILASNGFDHFVVVIDDQISHLGVTPLEAPETSLVAARDVTATIVAHELGHRFGAGHTYLAGPDGPIEYGGPYSVMGREKGKHDFVEEALNLPSEGANSQNARSGPGMCFANLTQTGWANPTQHAAHLKPYADGSVSEVVQLIALDGTPPVDEPNVHVACILELDDWYIVEYRSPASSYDAGVPNGLPPSWGDLVVYQSPPGTSLVPLQVAELGVLPGNILSFSDPLAATLAKKIGTPGVLIQLTILSVDPAGKKVSFRIEHRQGKPAQYERTDDIFDYLLWNRELISRDGHGLGRLVSALAEIQHLSRLQRISGPRDSAALGQVLSTRIKGLQELTRNMKL